VTPTTLDILVNAQVCESFDSMLLYQTSKMDHLMSLTNRNLLLVLYSGLTNNIKNLDSSLKQGFGMIYLLFVF